MCGAVRHVKCMNGLGLLPTHLKKSVGVTADTANVAWRTGWCGWKQQCMRVKMLMPLSQWRNVWRCTACQVYDWSGPFAYPPHKAVGVNAHTATCFIQDRLV